MSFYEKLWTLSIPQYSPENPDFFWGSIDNVRQHYPEKLENATEYFEDCMEMLLQDYTIENWEKEDLMEQWEDLVEKLNKE